MNAADFQRLEDALAEHGEWAFRKLRELHPGERFYSFAFYTNTMFDYLVPTAATHEGLRRVAERYQQDPRFSDQSLEALLCDLKWSPCDSPLHEEGEGLGVQGDELIAPFNEALEQLEVPDDDCTEFNQVVMQIYTVIANALIRIDQTGVFGTGMERDDVVVNLLIKNQSEREMIEFARRVNRPEAVQILVDDLKALDRDED